MIIVYKLKLYVILFIYTQYIIINIPKIYKLHRLLVSVLASSVVDLGVKSGQTKHDYIGILVHVNCSYEKHSALGSKIKDWMAHNQDNVSCGSICLPLDCVFCDVAL